MVFSLIFFVTLYTKTSNAQDIDAIQPTEYQVKAAFLYNFANFIEWPPGTFEDSEDQIFIGVLGEDPFGSDLDETVEGKIVKGKKLTIKRFKHVQEIDSCHILFISSSEKRRLKQILESLEGSNVLTVGDTEQFARDGVIINFILRRTKIRFEINANAAEKAGLKINSQLLRLAIIVE